jgi:hypothetical protein
VYGNIDMYSIIKAFIAHKPYYLIQTSKNEIVYASLNEKWAQDKLFKLNKIEDGYIKFRNKDSIITRSLKDDYSVDPKGHP